MIFGILKQVSRLPKDEAIYGRTPETITQP